MKVHDLAIIFIIIILPISLVLGIYTQYQIQTINTQTLYDNKLTSATYDAIRAFQINMSENSYSDLANSKITDIEASVSTFRNSIMSTFSLNGYSEEELNSYIPALLYTLYDGFYIYSPYTNTNYKNDDGENLYGLKPYISYSCRYVKDDVTPKIDVVITYALDNHITVQGMIGDEYVNKEGYLIDNISGKQDGSGNINNIKDAIFYNGVEIKEEQLKEYIGDQEYLYAKKDGTKYYLVGDTIAYISNGKVTVQSKKGDNNFNEYKEMIENNNSAKEYYYEAYKFTKWFKEESGLINLTYANAYDSVVDDNGNVKASEQIWKENNTKIFQFNTVGSNNKNIEDELSSFNQHRLSVIRHKIEVNLAIAIANYNNYSGAKTNNVFQMPELKEDEWEQVTHNISLISFLQGLPIGGKIYNGYSLVTNSESEEVVLEQNIYMLGRNTSTGKQEYYRIGDKGLEDNTVVLDTDSAGRLNLDFTRKYLLDNTEKKYYYPLKDYNASYNSIVMQNNVTTYDDIYEYVKQQNDDFKIAFYTALGRERGSVYTDYITSYKNYQITYYVDDVQYNQFKEREGDTHTIIDLPNEDGRNYIYWRDKNTGETYNSGDKIPNIQKDIELIAEYSYKKYTITYKVDGIQYSQANITHGGSHTIIDLPSENNGKVYTKWKDDKNGKTYNPGDEIKNIKNDIELNVESYIKTYKVTYYIDGIQYSQANISHGGSHKIINLPSENNGKVYTKWKDDKNGKTYNPGEEIKNIQNDIKLNVEYYIKTYKVTYYIDGAQYSQANISHGGSHTIINLPSNGNGKIYTNWKDNKTGKTYNSGEQIKNITEDINLSVQYKRIYTIKNKIINGSFENGLDSNWIVQPSSSKKWTSCVQSRTGSKRSCKIL